KRSCLDLELAGRDVALADRISAIADELGLTADVAAPRALELAVDALDIPAVLPFWRAVLGYVDDRHRPERLVDPAGVGPVVWFQQMDAPRPQRNRLHVDVDVPHDAAEQRVASAVAAGGRLVADDRAPAFWVLADPEGNEACVCTWQGRD
ncbi:MAG: VOC family protein, partial [Dietzia sp.]|nr:VOC family protein [Dietzia sp.]